MLIPKKKELVFLSGASGGRRDSRIFCPWTLQRLAETQIPLSSQLLPLTEHSHSLALRPVELTVTWFLVIACVMVASVSGPESSVLWHG